ncbi:uncharacterized protein LOC114574445 [Exaiptasia diaphana]|uniref:Uncharacterized protein n=1 Tax=Exaiptasia diaphana TaxID=2652724 RepID=A0A913YE66_EXADI|nr:uncharacterized protein LOC114574445 [Exaiptasia diaphana]
MREETGVIDEEDFNDIEDELDQEREKRTEEWVRKSQQGSIGEHRERSVVGEGSPSNQHNTQPTLKTASHRAHADKSIFDQFSPHALHTLRPFESTPIRDATGTILEALTTTNQKIVSGIAKQNLPKCHPDTFNGDATLFHPWKKAFKAMLSDIDVTPDQAINYLRKFTSGEAQRVVDNYRKRQSSNPTRLLGDLWSELERRFGSPAVITNVLLERLHYAANFDENDKRKLQEFSDICADVDSQIESLPGLACLNFPIAISPIVQRMPRSLRAKWDKEVAQFAEENNDAYPKFHNLAKIVEKQSIMRNQISLAHP